MSTTSHEMRKEREGGTYLLQFFPALLELGEGILVLLLHTVSFRFYSSHLTFKVLCFHVDLTQSVERKTRAGDKGGLAGGTKWGGFRSRTKGSSSKDA